MAYYKTENDGYIICVGIGAGETEIEEAEHNLIVSEIENKPTAPDGYDYRMKTDLTWELVEVPQQTEDEQKSGYTEKELLSMTNAELEYILHGYGLTSYMNKANMVKLIIALQGAGADE